MNFQKTIIGQRQVEQPFDVAAPDAFGFQAVTARRFDEVQGVAAIPRDTARERAVLPARRISRNGARTMPSEAAPHSTASICSRVGVLTRRRCSRGMRVVLVITPDYPARLKTLLMGRSWSMLMMTSQGVPVTIVVGGPSDADHTKWPSPSVCGRYTHLKERSAPQQGINSAGIVQHGQIFLRA